MNMHMERVYTDNKNINLKILVLLFVPANLQSDWNDNGGHFIGR